MLWVTNALQAAWEAQLPAEVQGTLAKSRAMRGGLFEGNTTMEAAAPSGGRQWATPAQQLLLQFGSLLLVPSPGCLPIVHYHAQAG